MKSIKIAFLTSSYSQILETVHQNFGVDFLIHTASTQVLPPKLRFFNAIKQMIGMQRNLNHWATKNNIRTASIIASGQDSIANEIRSNGIDILITSHAPILKPVVILSPRKLAINVHPSELPCFRGGSPLLWQVIDGVEKSAVTIHRLTEEVDHGEILAQHPYTILHGLRKRDIIKLSEQAGSIALSSVLNDLVSGRTLTGRPQTNHSPTRYARNIKREGLKDIIDWSDTSGLTLYNVLGYLDGWPIELGEPKNWVKYFPLKAHSYTNTTMGQKLGLVFYKGSWYLNSRNGAVRLSISWSPLSVIRHQKQRRLFHCGQLGNKYL